MTAEAIHLTITKAVMAKEISALSNRKISLYVRRACDDQIVLLTNQIEVIDHD